MMPAIGNMDPRQMAALMQKMGIRSEELDAARVKIEREGGATIVVEPAAVVKTKGLGKMEPRQMGRMMGQMGMKSEEIEAKRLTIEMNSGPAIVIESPFVLKMEQGGQVTFMAKHEESLLQISGMATEQGGEKEQSDAEIVASQTGVSIGEAQAMLDEAGGDIAEAIMRLEQRKV